MNGKRALLIAADGSKSGRIACALSAEKVSSTIEPCSEKARQALREDQYDVLLVCENALKEQIEEFSRSVRKEFPALTIVASLRERRPDLQKKLLDAGLDNVVTDRTPVNNIVKWMLLRIPDHTGACSGENSVPLGDVIVDFESLRVWKQGIWQPMSKGLARLLKYLIKNRRRPISRQEVTESLWEDSIVDPQGRNLDMQVVKLRRLTERDPKNPALIQTVRGVGYMLL